MTPFPSSGDSPAGGVTFSPARESNQRAHSSSQSPLTPFPPAAKTAFAPLLLLSPQSLKVGFAGAPCPLYTPFSFLEYVVGVGPACGDLDWLLPHWCCRWCAVIGLGGSLN